MLNVFLSRTSLKKQKSFKRNFKKIIIRTIVILITLGAMIAIDFFICNITFNSELTKPEIEEAEEVVLSYKKQISEAGSFYKENYDNLSYELKNNFELEFDELKISIKKNSEEEIHMIAKYKNYDNLEFILKDNKFEKFEKEKSVGFLVPVCVCFCMFIDLCIIVLILIGFFLFREFKEFK